MNWRRRLYVARFKVNGEQSTFSCARRPNPLSMPCFCWRWRRVNVGQESRSYPNTTSGTNLSGPQSPSYVNSSGCFESNLLAVLHLFLYNIHVLLQVLKESPMQRLLIAHSAHPVDPAASLPSQSLPNVTVTLCVGRSDDITRCTAEDIHFKKEVSLEDSGHPHVCEFVVKPSNPNVVGVAVIPSSVLVEGGDELSMCCSSSDKPLYSCLVKLGDSQPTSHTDVRLIERSLVRVLDDTFAVCITFLAVATTAQDYEAVLISEHLRTYRALTTPKIVELTKLKDAILDELLSGEKKMGEEIAKLKRSSGPARSMTPRGVSSKPILRPPPPPPPEATEEELSETDRLRKRIRELEAQRDTDLALHRAFVAEHRAAREKAIAAKIKKPPGATGRATTPSRSSSGARPTSGLSTSVSRPSPSRRPSSVTSTPQSRALTPTRPQVKPLDLQRRTPTSTRNPSPTQVRPSPATGDKVKRLEDNYMRLKSLNGTTPKAASTNGAARPNGTQPPPRFPPPTTRLESPAKARSGSVTSIANKPATSPAPARRTSSPLTTQRSMEGSVGQQRASSTSRKLLAMSPNTLYRSTSATPKTRLS